MRKQVDYEKVKKVPLTKEEYEYFSKKSRWDLYDFLIDEKGCSDIHGLFKGPMKEDEDYFVVVPK